MFNRFLVAPALVACSCSSIPLGLDSDAARPAGKAPPSSVSVDAALEDTATTSAASVGAEPDALEAEDARSDARAAPDVIEWSDAAVDTGADTADGSDASDAGAPDGDAATTTDTTPPPSGTCVPANCGTHSWACWRMPNSPNSGLPNPAHYTDMGDGTVRDDVTCLLWQKQAPASTAYTWSDAKLKCTQNPLLGGVGWRLPSRIELMSIVEYARRDPTISLAVFPATLQSPPYWTWSPLPGSPESYAVSFHDGTVLHADQSTMYLARCVRGNGESQDLPGGAPNDHYTIGVDAVLDRYTGLTWQRGDSRGTSSLLLPYEGAERYCAGLALAGGGWRLPSVKELATLVDEARLGSALPAVDLVAFPSTALEVYWSSTQHLVLSFADATTAAGTAGFVRCVR